MTIITNEKPIKESLQEYARGIAGGLLFSFPILYTMEVWWAGFIATPFALLVLTALTFCLLLGYNRYAGMRPDASWGEVVIDSFEEMGLGLILSFAVLLTLNRIHLGSMAVDEIIGKIIIEGMFVSIGVSVGTAQLGTGNAGGKGDDKKEDKNEEVKKNKEEDDDEKDVSSYRESKTAVAVLALCGSIIIGGNVAPTEEVLMIALEVDPLHVLIMAILSISLSVLISSFIDFKGTTGKKSSDFLYHITFDTCISYVVALVASAFVLWFFGRFGNTDFWHCFSQIIVLGVLSSIGASAGRLLIK